MRKRMLLRGTNYEKQSQRNTVRLSQQAKRRCAVRNESTAASLQRSGDDAVHPPAFAHHRSDGAATSRSQSGHVGEERARLEKVHGHFWRAGELAGGCLSLVSP